MIYTNHRDAYRQTFLVIWQKHQKKLALEPMEAQLLAIILSHPEYHTLLDGPESAYHQEFALEENPFFHMSLHLAIQEQIQNNRPFGIQPLHQQLIDKCADTHAVEHQMMECLAKTLWTAQQKGTMPDEQDYLEKLKAI